MIGSRRTVMGVGAGIAMVATSGAALGHGELEVFIGRTAGNQLSFHAEPHADEAVHVPRSVFPNLTGYATPGIGFESLGLDMPGDGLFVLAPLAEIGVRFVGADAGVSVYNGLTALTPGSVMSLGEVPFDNHPLFNIHGVGAMPGQVFGVRLVLTDASGLYADSAEFTLEVTPACAADIDLSGTVSVQDIFDYLALYFQNLPGADINGAGGVTVQDIFDFLTAYFTPCG